MSVSEYRAKRRVEFADTDMGGLVHFSRFFVFMETAEHEFLRSLGTTAHGVTDGEAVGWPRLAASCEYLSPARFGDELEIRLRVQRKGTKSMTYAFEIHGPEGLVARGQVSAICCRIHPGARLESIPIPAALAERIGEAKDPA